MSFKTSINLAFALAIACAFAAPTMAENKHNITNGYTLDDVPLALHGVDTVALSTLNTVSPGTATQTVIHDGVACYFASSVTAKVFTADPALNLPQYGGFCAFVFA